MNPISSVTLIQLLGKMCTEINTLSLEYLLLTDGINLSRLMYGHTRRKVKYAAWLEHDVWLGNARDKINDINQYLESVHTTQINKLIDCCPQNQGELSSLEEQFIKVYDKIFEVFWNNNLYAIQNRVISCLQEMSVSHTDIEYIRTAEDPHIISVYLVTEARNNSGQEIQGIRQMKVRSSQNSIKESKSGIDSSQCKLSKATCEATNPKKSEPVSSNKQMLQLRTYFDLQAQGMSALEIIKQLISNDDALYGENVYGERANTPENWAEQLTAAPENWLFFCDGSCIVANWSCTFLSPDEEEFVRKGLFAGRDFSLDSVNYPVSATDKEVVIYLHNMSLNEGYQTTGNWVKLWKSFGQRLKQLLQSGITVKSIYACLFRPDHKKIFEQMGFKVLIENAVSGEVYHLNLAQQSIEQFSWIMPNLSEESEDATYLGQSISFKQLSSHDVDRLTEQELIDIASLVFDTDSYVYSALFSSRKQAKKLLRWVFESNQDTMFNLENVFCAMFSTESGRRIVGIILHTKGPLNWSSKHLLHYAELFDEKLPDTVDAVERDYFKCYDKTPPESRAILNVCVNSNFRMRDELRLGTQMMQAFLQEHPNERMELYVLEETRAAMRLYLHRGFEIVEKCNGFSIPKKELPCYFMCRPAK